MSIVLVDTCVLTDLAMPGSEWFQWSANTLEALDLDYRFVINLIIYAECSIGYATIEEMEAFIAHLDFPVRPLPREALFLAGKTFFKY